LIVLFDLNGTLTDPAPIGEAIARSPSTSARPSPSKRGGAASGMR